MEAQGLSDHEIQKLTTDRHQLDEANRVTSAKLTEAVQKSHELEIALSRAYSDVEKLTEQYHESASKLGLLPTGPEGFEDIDFSQELNGTSKTPQGLVPDCTTRIRPALIQLKQNAARGRYASENEALKLEEELGRIADQVAEVNEILADAEARHEMLQSELADSKEVRVFSYFSFQSFKRPDLRCLQSHATFVETSGSSIDKLSKSNAELRNHVSGALVAADQRLQALENE